MVYGEALKRVDVVMDKLHNLCALLVERAENHLHEERFTGVVDKFALTNQLLHLELAHQEAKLQYMLELMGVFEQTPHPEGLWHCAREIATTCLNDVYPSVTGFGYRREYEDSTSCLLKKRELLGVLASRQRQWEKQEVEGLRAELAHHNHTNNLPEISCTFSLMQLFTTATSWPWKKTNKSWRSRMKMMLQTRESTWPSTAPRFGVTFQS